MKKILPDVIAVVAFILIAFVYFFPADIEGRVLFQHDTAAGVGQGQEMKVFHDQTGETSRWTNALFGGMPSYQIAPSYDSNKPLNFLENLYRLYLPDYVKYVFILMLGFYIMLRAMGMSVWLSGLGSVLWAFSSYFFILISAGHLWKLITLAYIPPTIAGIILTFRKKHLLGGVLTAFFLALQIKSNHVQMSYYFLFVILAFALAYLYEAWKKKELAAYFTSCGVLLISALVGIAINASSLYHTYEYSKQTMRGKSELVQTDVSKTSQTNGGLDRDYITQWSYGIGETLSLLVPNVKGGASVPLVQNKTAMKKADPRYTQAGIYHQLTQYFGDQPMTSGPVYVGAFVMFLFILGCFIVKGPIKWALVGATLFSILLSWGKNFMPLTDFFIDFVPMYNKFRAVSSILVIAEFTIPLLAILALKQILQQPTQFSFKTNKVALTVSLALTAGVALILAFMPSLLFSGFIPTQEMAMLQQAIPQPELTSLTNNLTDMRQALVIADARRSLVILLIGLALLWLFAKRNLRSEWTTLGIIVLCVVDLYAVDKRYLNDDQFIPASNKLTIFKQSATDREILQDSTLDYRVLNFATNTFNENNTSYWHKSIGGYHAAKLRRYQDLIEHHIAPEMQKVHQQISVNHGDMEVIDPTKFPVINMLNTRYFILPLQGERKTMPLQNPYAMGNAWFVDHVTYVDNANAEIAAIAHTDLKRTAIVDKRFETVLGKPTATVETDSTYQIVLTHYAPNKLIYHVENPREAVAVLSEVYYPGWQATVDETPVDIARANYILRAIRLPQGKHTLTLTFDPQSLHITESIATGGYAVLFTGLIFLVFGTFRPRKRKKYMNHSSIEYK